MKHASHSTANIDRLIIVSLIVAGLAGHFLISLRYGVAVPTIHDEFGYLLTADTFAHGRLTNPTHPLWEHFQTFHVFFQPTYQAKYPPFQGLFMAIGQVVCGQPIWGVWLSMALAYAAVFWLMRAWFDPLPALAGTLLVVLEPNIMQHWGHTYWGGGVALLGGALFFGGIGHARTRPTVPATCWMALGAIILANSRPYEGAVVVATALPVLAVLGVKSLRTEGAGRTVRAYVLPLGIGAVLAVGWLLIYNAALGGDPLKFYYLNWKAGAATVDMVRNYHGSPPTTSFLKLLRLWHFFLGPYLSLAVVGLVLVFKRRQMIFEAAAVVILTVASMWYSKAWPHYIAPVAPLIYLLVFAGFYELARIDWFKRRGWSGAALGVMVAVYAVLAVAGAVALFGKGPAYPFNGKLHTRKAIADKLTAEPGKDLVVIAYGPSHNPNEEWVYNRADIDASEIVWARDLGAEKNRRLFDYYADRHVWMVYPDEKPVRLMRLGQSANGQAPARNGSN